MNPMLTTIHRGWTHPDLFTLEDVDLSAPPEALLHHHGQQGVVGAAVQHGAGLEDGGQGEGLQLSLGNGGTDGSTGAG